MQKVNRFLVDVSRRFNRPATTPTPGAKADSAARLQGVTGALGRRTWFKDLNLLLPPGRLLAVTGRRGSGKSELLHILSGLKPPRLGSAEICGNDALKEPVAVRRKSAYVPSRFIHRPGWRLGTVLLQQARLCGVPGKEAGRRVAILAERFGLTSRLTVESGRLRPIEIAMAGLLCGLLRAPDLLCVDEPHLGLDRTDRRLFWDEMGRIRDQGIAVAAASCNMGDPWRIADEVMLLSDGRALYPSADELAKLEQLSGILQVKLEVAPKIMPPELAAFRPRVEGRTLIIHSSDPMSHLVDVIEAILGAGLRVEDFGIRDSEILEDLFHEPGKSQGEGRS